MKVIIRYLVGCVFYIYAIIVNVVKPRFVSIYFHDPSVTVFEDIVCWLVEQGYSFLTFNELDTIIENRKLPIIKSVFISFDDGWRSNIDLLSVCEKYNVPITIFISTKPLESGNFWWEYVLKRYDQRTVNIYKKKKYDVFLKDLAKVKEKVSLQRSALTVEELIKISKHPLVTIQSHTVNHPILTNVSDLQLHMELVDSKQKIESLINNEVIAFSYPNGDVGVREVDALKSAGYKYAFTTKSDEFDINRLNPYLIPRMAMNTHGSKYENISKILGIWQKILG